MFSVHPLRDPPQLLQGIQIDRLEAAIQEKGSYVSSIWGGKAQFEDVYGIGNF